MTSPTTPGAASEKKPVPPTVQAYLDLMRAREHLGRPILTLFKRHGLSEATYNVLRILRGAGEPGLACREVGKRLVNAVPDVTRLVDRLEALSFVQRERSSEDRRVWLVRLTEAGRELLGELDQPVNELHEAQFEELSPEELALLSNLLQRLAPRSGAGSSTQPKETKQ